MPCNQASGVSCRIALAREPHVLGGPSCEEYQHHAARSSVTDAIQEIVFVESTAGSLFEIILEIAADAHSKLHRRGAEQDARLHADDYLVDVHLDGVTVSRSVIQPTRSSRPKRFRLYSSISSDHRTMRMFQFGQLALVDADDSTLGSEAANKLEAELCNDERVISNLGSIRVDIIRCQFGAPRALSPESSPCLLRTSNQMKFSERSKKACLSNTAGLSENSFPSPFAKEKDIFASPIEWQDPNPFLQFVFNYRSRALLEAQGIVRPPTPRPSESIKLASDRSKANTILRKPLREPRDEEIKPKPTCIEIDSDDDKKQDIKPKPKYSTQSACTTGVAGSSEDVKKRVKKNGPSTPLTTKTEKQHVKRILVVDDIDQDEQKRKKNKSKVIDLTQD